MVVDEVRPGYKRTEVGSVPEYWEIKSLRDMAVIRTGPLGTLLKASEYSGNYGVPLISVGEIGIGKTKISDRAPFVPVAVVRRLPQYLLRAGDIVFGRKGAVERSALITEVENGWFLGSDGLSISCGARINLHTLHTSFKATESALRCPEVR